MQDKRCSLNEAVQMIEDGSMITFSGFTIWRRPMATIYEMLRQGKRNLHLIEVNSGTHSEMLIGAGAVSIWESNLPSVTRTSWRAVRLPPDYWKSLISYKEEKWTWLYPS